MCVVDVNIVGTESLETGVDFVHQVNSTGPLFVRTFSHGMTPFGCQNHVGAPVGNGFADNPLRFASTVNVCGINKVDPLVEGVMNDANRVLFVRLSSKHHGAEADT